MLNSVPNKEKEKALAFSFLKRNGNGKKRENRLTFLIFVAPIFLLFTLLFIVPLVQGVYYAFTDWDAVNPVLNFVGLKNFVKIFTIDSNFIPAMGRTFYFVIFNVFLSNTIGMLFAIAFTNDFRFNNMFRSMIFIPNVISMVIGGFIWQFMFLKVMPQTAAKFSFLSFLDQSWLSDSNIVMFSIVIVSLWQGLGFMMTIFIAGLQGIDSSLIEAGTIDGASGWQSFWNIKLPAVLPTVAVGAFMNIAGSFKIFDTVFSLTSGGPGRSSEVAMLEIYREAYTYKNFGYASAKAVLLALVIIIFTIIQLKLTSDKEGY
ncbi:MAG: sugar ABC transporter permease [Clostridia bacterium]